MCDTLIEVEKLTNQVNEMNKKAENYHNLMIIRNRIQSIPFVCQFLLKFLLINIELFELN